MQIDRVESTVVLEKRNGRRQSASTIIHFFSLLQLCFIAFRVWSRQTSNFICSHVELSVVETPWRQKFYRETA